MGWVLDIIGVISAVITICGAISAYSSASKAEKARDAVVDKVSTIEASQLYKDIELAKNIADKYMTYVESTIVGLNPHDRQNDARSILSAISKAEVLSEYFDALLKKESDIFERGRSLISDFSNATDTKSSRIAGSNLGTYLVVLLRELNNILKNKVGDL